MKLKDVATKGVITTTSDDNFFYRVITAADQCSDPVEQHILND